MLATGGKWDEMKATAPQGHQSAPSPPLPPTCVQEQRSGVEISSQRAAPWHPQEPLDCTTLWDLHENAPPHQEVRSPPAPTRKASQEPSREWAPLPVRGLQSTAGWGPICVAAVVATAGGWWGEMEGQSQGSHQAVPLLCGTLRTSLRGGQKRGDSVPKHQPWVTDKAGSALSLLEVLEANKSLKALLLMDLRSFWGGSLSLLQ